MTVSKDQSREIDNARKEAKSTLRATVPAVEEILLKPFQVLDHGFVRVIDYMGSDEAVVQAARVSYGRGTKKLSDDRSLIRYLMRKEHTSPLEMCEIKLHVKLPIFVARQWIRHRMASVNEYSARYSILDKEFYLPKLEAMGVQDTLNRQGRGRSLSLKKSKHILDILKADATRCYSHYEEFLGLSGEDPSFGNGEGPLARELARIVLPLNFYTQWYWKIDLRNLLHFLELRLEEHAQYEIRAYAFVIAGIVEHWAPLVWEAFSDYGLKAVKLSSVEAAIMRQVIAGGRVDQHLIEELSSGEREELKRKLGIDVTRLG